MRWPDDHWTCFIKNHHRPRSTVSGYQYQRHHRLDIDHLKEINDSFGHDAGDQVLVTISQRISAVLRKADTFARFGGDEFMMLLTEIESSTAVAQIATKILDSVAVPIDFGQDQVKVTASIGIALYPDDGRDIAVLIKKSDQMMYQVKHNGRNNARFYGNKTDHSGERP